MGATGEHGPKGERGYTGPPGPQGVQGPVGPMGPKEMSQIGMFPTIYTSKSLRFVNAKSSLNLTCIFFIDDIIII